MFIKLVFDWSDKEDVNQYFNYVSVIWEYWTFNSVTSDVRNTFVLYENCFYQRFKTAPKYNHSLTVSETAPKSRSNYQQKTYKYKFHILWHTTGSDNDAIWCDVVWSFLDKIVLFPDSSAFCLKLAVTKL